ncbi:helix-turn-helix transcriptional regulator [Fibrella aquatica]|jgi:AraC-like DNA-binding protein|uniref:helix-turn-helix transcriptional regulator n=1 Tax=Fibrella aquatica TaxID=3242487 RepID=UPI0035213453
MTIAPLDLILLLGSLQGLILGTLLWISRRGNRLSNRLLGVLIGLLALMSLAMGIPVTNRWVSLATDLLPLFMVMPLGPLIYFYTRSVLDPAFQLGPAERRHFYPVVLDWVAPLIGWTFLIGQLLGFFEQKDGPVWGHSMQAYNTYVDIPRWLAITVYLILTKRLLTRQPAPAQGSTTAQNLRWLRQFVSAMLVFQVLWLLFMVPYLIPGWRGPLLERLGWYPVYIPIAILIYWLGLRGYLRNRLEYESIPARPTNADMPPELVAEVVVALTKAMETDQLFLNPELTVDKLSKHLQLSPKLISAVLNQQLQTNFNSFINRYRVEAVKRQLATPGSEHLTITGIAFNCGFNSQATFQRVFKQMTSLSPKEYLSQHRKTSSQIRN